MQSFARFSAFIKRIMRKLCKAIVRPNTFLNLKLQKGSVKLPLTFTPLLPFNPPNVFPSAPLPSHWNCPTNPPPPPHLNKPPPHNWTSPQLTEHPSNKPPLSSIWTPPWTPPWNPLTPLNTPLWATPEHPHLNTPWAPPPEHPHPTWTHHPSSTWTHPHWTPPPPPGCKWANATGGNGRRIIPPLTSPPPNISNNLTKLLKATKFSFWVI